MFICDHITWTETASLAAKARMSAQDTFPAHLLSSSVFISSITSKPVKDRFGIASFSAVLFAVEFIKTEPSQPCRSLIPSQLDICIRITKCGDPTWCSSFIFKHTDSIFLTAEGIFKHCLPLRSSHENAFSATLQVSWGCLQHVFQ